MKQITAHDPETKSADVIAGNIQQLMSFFPEAVCEGKLDFEVLKQLLGGVVDEREEKYGLNWHGKRRARQLALTPSAGTLRPCPEESIDWGTTQNLMIEGDNLEVLKLLQKSYAGKVKLIYIDPPYNTGKDFVYPDNFHDNIRNYLELTGQTNEGGKNLSSNTESSGRFHTAWLNMMLPRLKLARTLLREDGVIFISIDDNEVANLRHLLDEIFGPENFVANVIWQKKYAVSSDAKGIPAMHDHILVYQRSVSFKPNMLPRTEKQDAIYKNPDNDPRGLWRPDNLTRNEYRERDCYPITSPKTGDIFYPPKGASWRHPREEVERMIADNRIWFGLDGHGRPAPKRFLSEVRQGIVASAWWPFSEVGHNDESKKELMKVFGGESPFDTPKPSRLIERMLQVSTAADAGDIVLDFFAGSGTTGHALYTMNLLDNGTRRFILIQLPEQTNRTDFATIADITKERLRRVGRKLREENPSFAGDLGFRVFQLDSSNINAWDPGHENLDQALLDSIEHIKPDRSDDDVLYELLLKLGLDLCVPIEQTTIAKKVVQSIGAGALMVCLATKISRDDAEPLALGIIEWHRELNPAGETTVVFRDTGFADDVAKTNLTAILQQHGLENVRSL
jgi:adenine-specific DNA-methyltransferase